MRLAVLLLSFVAGTAVPYHLHAQVRASEAATVSQTIDGTVITVAYSRPQARGRDSLFGGVVHYGQLWTPGANWGTTLEVSKDVQVNGTAVPKGTYSLWMLPARGEWTVVLDTQARRFHTQRPPESTAQIRFPVRPDSGEHTEMLTWHFPSVGRHGATLELRWGSTVVSLDVAVPPTGRGWRRAPGDAYVGTYRLTVAGAGDSSHTIRADVFEKDSALRLRLTPNPFPERDRVVELRPLSAEHRFEPVFRKNGAVVDVETSAAIVFTLRNGRATGFDLLGMNDGARGSAVRED